MSAYGRDGFGAQAEEVLWSMQKEGLKPDTVSFNTVLAGLVRAGDYLRAQQVYKEMGKQGCPRDYVTYRTMMRAYNMLGWYHHVWEMGRKMKIAKKSQKKLVSKDVVKKEADRQET